MDVGLGGEGVAGAAGGESFNPAELVCGGCSDVSRAQMCPRHGADYLEYKCRYCCSVAVFFCFGTTHFCNACHEDFRHVTEMPKHALPKCPAGQYRFITCFWPSCGLLRRRMSTHWVFLKILHFLAIGRSSRSTTGRRRMSAALESPTDWRGIRPGLWHLPQCPHVLMANGWIHR